MHGQKSTPHTPARGRSLARSVHQSQKPPEIPNAPSATHAQRPGTGRAPVEKRPPFLTAQADGVTLAIKLQPRASRTEIGELSGPALRIKVTAPPVDSAANEALIRLLAETLDCPRSQVQLIRGQTSRNKVVKVYGLRADEVLLRLGA